jgi:hypothetical protein
MKDTLKLSLICLLVAFLWNMAATQEVDWWKAERHNRVVILRDARVGHWATMFKCNMRNLSDDADPFCTEIITSWYPIVTKTGENRWTITFAQK